MPDSAPDPAIQPVRPRLWQGRLLRLCFAIFAFEVGLVLVILPWMDTWNLNYFQGLVPVLQDIWDDSYFRGAVTGLGFVNIYIALLELVRLLRRA
jgi:hypothetical protein